MIMKSLQKPDSEGRYHSDKNDNISRQKDDINALDKMTWTMVLAHYTLLSNVASAFLFSTSLICVFDQHLIVISIIIQHHHSASSHQHHHIVVIIIITYYSVGFVSLGE